MRHSTFSPRPQGGIRWTPVPAEAVRVPPVWWTVERGLYVLLFLGALLLRFSRLGTRPLGPAEAHQAWLAWVNTQPGLHHAVVHVSPLAYALQWLTFLLTGGSDALARGWSALAGALLVLLPYGLREVIGRRRALFLSGLLAFSPQLVYWSRHGSGTALGLFFTLLLLVLLVRWLARGGYLEAREDPPAPAVLPHLRRDLVWIGVALACALMSTDGVYAALLGLAVGLWPWRRAIARAWRHVGGQGHHRAALLFLLTLFGVGTVFLTDIPALGNVADLVGQWVASLWRGRGYPWYWVPFRLLADEPLLTVLALWGAWRSVRQKDVWGRVWWGWALVLLLLGLRAGRTSVDVAFLLLPMAFLAADALEHVVHLLTRPSPTWREEWVLAAATFVIEAFWFMMFAGYVETLESRYLPAMIVVPLLLLGLALMYGWWLRWEATLRVASISLLITGLIWTGMALWVQNLHLSPDAALDALPGIERTTTHPNLRLMMRTLERISAERMTDLHEMPLDVIYPPDGDVLRWYMRVFKNAQEIYGPKGARADVVIAPRQVGEIPGYTGMDWIITTTQLPTQLGGRIYHWWLYREAPLSEERQEVILWYRAGTSK